MKPRHINSSNPLLVDELDEFDAQLVGASGESEDSFEYIDSENDKEWDMDFKEAADIKLPVPGNLEMAEVISVPEAPAVASVQAGEQAPASEKADVRPVSRSPELRLRHSVFFAEEKVSEAKKTAVSLPGMDLAHLEEELSSDEDSSDCFERAIKQLFSGCMPASPTRRP